MKINSSAVIKKDGKWFLGFIQDNSFKSKRQIKKLSDAKDISDYKTLKNFLKEKLKNYSEKDYEKYLKKLNVEKCYILEKPVELTGREWEKWWWNNLNPLCINCKKSCKQSSRVEIVNCWKITGEK